MGLKSAVFRLLGKDPEAVVVSFLSGPEPLARAMLSEVRSLVPDREHYAVTTLQIEGVACLEPSKAGRALRRKRIGLAPTLFTPDREYSHLRRLAFGLAPFRVLAFNNRLERHHLRLRTFLASFLFLWGVPLDRIFLRPSFLVPWKKDRSTSPTAHQVFEGRIPDAKRRRVAIVSPYLPFPLSHGGAVRIYNLIRQTSRDFDIFLFSFAEPSQTPTGTPLLDLCARVVLFRQPRYREPRWASLNPPEVNEFASSYVARIIADYCRQYDLRCTQLEYTQMASYSGQILVEHDVTFDLHQQVYSREKSWGSWWNLWRWRRYETNAIRRFKNIVAMSDKDASLLEAPHVRVIPNGVDLKRFAPQLEPAGENLLFVGSFRHFPNVLAFQFFIGEVWPLLASRPKLRLTVIAGPDPHLYCSDPLPDPRIELHAFVSDVRPFYARSNIVIVPTRVSAGTNLKVLEALAAERAVVSTTSGCAGLALEHGRTAWIADDPAGLALGITTLLDDDTLRVTLARAGHKHAVEHFSWTHIARLQSRLWTEIITGITVRPATRADLPDIEQIQNASHFASQWHPATYFEFEVRVASRNGAICGFLVSREVLGEVEILNLAVDPSSRRSGVATALIDSLSGNVLFLEVRESNTSARNLYWKLGFRVVGRREEYYENPVETALVMRLSRMDESATV